MLVEMLRFCVHAVTWLADACRLKITSLWNSHCCLHLLFMWKLCIYWTGSSLWHHGSLSHPCKTFVNQKSVVCYTSASFWLQIQKPTVCLVVSIESQPTRHACTIYPTPYVHHLCPCVNHLGQQSAFTTHLTSIPGLLKLYRYGNRTVFQYIS